MKLLDKLLSFEGACFGFFILFSILMLTSKVEEGTKEQYKAECIKQGKVYFVQKGTPGTGSYEEGCR